jgi:glycosyltransferase involved in cell wall biosynthesis
MVDASNIDVLIVTRDEEANLPHALASVAGWTRRVFVVDSGSTDNTEQIARDAGAEFVHHEWPGYARQKNWALDNLAFEAPWVLILDADELVLPELRDELLRIAGRQPDQVPISGYFVNRYTIFLGRRIRHCGYYPIWNLRFFKRGQARYEDRRVHEHMMVNGPTAYLRGHIEHWDRRGIEHMVAKHNWYSSLEAEEATDPKLPAQKDVGPAPFGNPIARRRWIKRAIVPLLPMRWLWRFFYMYFMRLGILDGVAGLHLSLFMACYQFMIDLKIKEVRYPEDTTGTSAQSGGKESTA